MHSSNIQGFVSRVLKLYEEEDSPYAVRLNAHTQFNFYIIFLCNGIHNIPLLSASMEKRVSAPEAHKRYFRLTLETLLYSFVWKWQKLLQQNLCNFWTKMSDCHEILTLNVWRLLLFRNHIDLTTVVPSICQTGNLLSDVLLVMHSIEATREAIEIFSFLDMIHEMMTSSRNSRAKFSKLHTKVARSSNHGSINVFKILYSS